MKTHRERERDIPVVEEVDVLVAGAGPAGFGAAVAAARNGARTLLVEKNGVIGGTATAGLMISWGVRGRFWDGRGEHIITGLPWEFQKSIVDLDGAAPFALRRETAPYKVVFDVEVYKRVAVRMLREAGCRVLLHTSACDTVMDGTTVRGLVVENKAGRQAILASQVIDATGCCHVCQRSGARVNHARGVGGNTFMYVVGGVDTREAYRYFEARKERLRCWSSFKRSWDEGYFRWGFLELEKDDGLDEMKAVFDDALREGHVTESELGWYPRVAGRDNVAEDDVGYDLQGVEARAGGTTAVLWGMAATFDYRNEAKISSYQLAAVEKAWLFCDKILRRLPGFRNAFVLSTPSDFGVRAGGEVQTDYEVTEADRDTGVVFDDVVGRYSLFKAQAERYQSDPPRGFDIPLRQLLVRGVDRLYAVGRCTSFPKPQTACMVLGESAGITAALAARKGTSARDLDVAELQASLRANRINIGR